MRRWAVLSSILILATGLAAASESPTYREITAPEVKDMLDRELALVVHVLSAIEYEMQHIPGSINIPITQLEQTDRLPEDPDFPIVFYCMGTR